MAVAHVILVTKISPPVVFAIERGADVIVKVGAALAQTVAIAVLIPMIPRIRGTSIVVLG
jgi:hypothetical protein